MKKLKSLKQQYQKEEEAFIKSRKIYIELVSFSDEKILDYFDLSTRQALIVFTEQLKLAEHGEDEVAVQRDTLCVCTDMKGAGKALYETKDEAETVCTLRRKESGEKLSVYTCPTANGWHLTKM